MSKITFEQGLAGSMLTGAIFALLSALVSPWFYLGLLASTIVWAYIGAKKTL